MIKIRIPKNFFDELPPAPPYIPVTGQEDEDDTQSDSGSIFRTACHSYGILREYPCGKPSITPDNHKPSITPVLDSSARFQFSKAFCPKNTTQLYGNSCL